MGMFDFILGSGNASIDPNVASQTANINKLSGKMESHAGATQAKITSLYDPVEKKFVTDAQNYDSMENQDLAAGAAGTQVRNSFDKAGQTNLRYLASMGINPNTGRSLDTLQQTSMARAAAEAQAQNDARLQVRQQGINMRSGVVQQGNVVTNQALGEQQAAMGGYNNSANISLGVTQMNEQAKNGRLDRIGTLVGAGIGAAATMYKPPVPPGATGGK